MSMVSMTAWEKLAYTVIAQIDEEIETLERETQEKLNTLNHQRDALLDSINVLKERLGEDAPTESGMTVSKSEIVGKTQREILELIAAKTGGILVAKDAIRMMIQLDVFGNVNNAESMVYSLLSRGKQFEKVTPGVYRVRPETSVPTTRGKAKRIRRSNPALTHSIVQLRRTFPDANRQTVRDMLISQRFDFGTSNPTAAVNGAWLTADKRLSEQDQQKTPQLIMVSG